MMDKKRTAQLISKISIALTLSLMTTVAVLYGAVSIRPAVGAQSVDTLRGIIGDKAVAQIETVAFQMTDTMRGWEYNLGITKPAPPWNITTSSKQAALPRPITMPATTTSHPPVQNPIFQPARFHTPISHAFLASVHVSTPLIAATHITIHGSTKTVTALASKHALPTATPTPLPTPTPVPTISPPWSPAPIKMAGTHQQGAGQWSIYLRNRAGQPIAYRAFLRPDPRRPYALAAIVAFDLKATRLHFVLGTKGPRSGVKIRRPGCIPPQDFQAGRLIAVFNGGFKARHGHFGTMVHGITVLPPRQRLGTIAMYADGRVRIGMWGTELTPSPNIQAWRQNGPLVIHKGQVNPHTADYAPLDWGYTVKGAIAVWRSGLGISADGRTLYYVAGNSLTLPALARTLAAVGAYQAVQLDINNYWVHFDAIKSDRSGVWTEPLFSTMKSQDDNRYLKRFWRDFFYMTVNNKNSLPAGNQMAMDQASK